MRTEFQWYWHWQNYLNLKSQTQDIELKDLKYPILGFSLVLTNISLLKNNSSFEIGNVYCHCVWKDIILFYFILQWVRMCTNKKLIRVSKEIWNFELWNSVETIKTFWSYTKCILWNDLTMNLCCVRNGIL